MSENPLDRAVRGALADGDRLPLPPPDVLLLARTGAGALLATLELEEEIVLGDLAGTPRAWQEATLLCARGGELRWWLVGGDPDPAAEGPPWARAFPVWLGAAAGARAAIVTSAGSALPRGEVHTRAGRLGVVRDHLNLSGRSPLTGLGESRFGPLFPDTTRVHDPGLARAAHGRAEQLGLELVDLVVACSAGPAVETPAERAWMAGAGADACVQGLADPLLAMAHAGLSGLSIVALLDGGERPLSLRDMVAEADRLAPSLEELVLALAPDIAEHVAAAREEEA